MPMAKPLTKTVSIGLPPRPWQAECYRKRRRFAVLALHRRAGKTEWALQLLLHEGCKASPHKSRLYAYIAPFQKQAKQIAWHRLKQLVEPLILAGAAQTNEVDLTVELAGGATRIRLYGADNPDALRGVRLDGVVVDEVAQIRPEVWEEIVQPALSDRLGWAAFIGTPKGVNLFSQLFYAAEGKPDWCALRYTVYDTGALDPEEVERLRNGGMSETSFAREYLCDFAASGEDQLVSLTDAEAASRRVYVERDVAGQPVILGVDPARFGDDRSVIVRRQGLQVFRPIVLRGIDNMQLAARVAQEIGTLNPDAVFIDAGAGSGVIDRLRQLGHAVSEVPFGGKAIEPTLYLNRRSEMWCKMADWLRSGAIPPDCHELKAELATPIYWYDAQGRKCLESKEDIKKRLSGGASPDIADALALTFAAPVSRRVPLPEDWSLRRAPKKVVGNPFAPRKR